MYYRLLMNLGVYAPEDIESYVDIVAAGLNATGKQLTAPTRQAARRAG